VLKLLSTAQAENSELLERSGYLSYTPCPQKRKPPNFCPKSDHHVLPLLFDCQVLHTTVYAFCETVRSAILASAWLLVHSWIQISNILLFKVVDVSGWRSIIQSAYQILNGKTPLPQLLERH